MPGGWRSLLPPKPPGAAPAAFSFPRKRFMPNPLIMQFFEFNHLPDHLPDHLNEVSKPIGEMALHFDIHLPDSAEKTVGLRKLLEAKDCFVRAALPALR
jgi:hypothetical protein